MQIPSKDNSDHERIGIMSTHVSLACKMRVSTKQWLVFITSKTHKTNRLMQLSNKFMSNESMKRWANTAIGISHMWIHSKYKSMKQTLLP